jgi:hypothetical protein
MDNNGEHTAAKVTKELCLLAFKAEDNASLAISCLDSVRVRMVVKVSV